MSERIDRIREIKGRLVDLRDDGSLTDQSRYLIGLALRHIDRAEILLLDIEREVRAMS